MLRRRIYMVDVDLGSTDFGVGGKCGGRRPDPNRGARRRGAGPLAEGLDRLGWRTITARGPYAALAALGDLQIEGVIVDLASAGHRGPIARKLKAACAPRRLPVIAIGEPDRIAAEPGFDLTLAAPLHPAQAAMRLESLVRTAIAEEEFELRLETFAERGRRLDLPEPPVAVSRSWPSASRPRSSWPCPTPWQAQRRRRGRRLHRLHGLRLPARAPFDAVVLWAGDNQQEALSIAAGMRRNTRLFHIPAMLYLKEESYVTMSEAFHRGVSDVASPETPESETAKRVIELARSLSPRRVDPRRAGQGAQLGPDGRGHRPLHPRSVRRPPGPPGQRRSCAQPPAVGLRAEGRPKPSTSAGPPPGGWLDRAIPQIGSMIGRLVRVEDTAARLAPEVFALALPATNRPPPTNRRRADRRRSSRLHRLRRRRRAPLTSSPPS
jgi:two-component system cell cycle response regulator PopA